MRKLLHLNIGLVIRRVLGRDNRQRIESQPGDEAWAEKQAAEAPANFPPPMHDEPPVQAEHKDEPQNQFIWMIERDRYGVRGRALCTLIEVSVSEAVNLCDGIQGYVLNAPNGDSVVVEARTGGLVGLSLEAVLDGIREMTSSELIKQIDRSKKEFDRMKPIELPPALFWSELRMSDEELALPRESD